ncbi:MAG TPA: hypothetical protein PLW93_01155, partial [Candidatus Absconditabacterales bacterium]|nr:hypothetical protein [Candidatus Absconditabacterales bacterium]
MSSLESCKLLLKQTVLVQSRGQYIPLSQLTTSAWGDSKSECIQAFGGSSNVKAFIDSINLNETFEDNSGIHASADIKDVGLLQKTSGTSSFWEYIKKQVGLGGSSLSSPQRSKKIDSTQSTGVIATVSKPQQVESSVRYTKDNLIGYAWDVMFVLIGLLIIYGLLRMMRYIFQLMYDFFNAHRMVYLKVLAPRGDSKGDREKEREISKDMKEKIGRMSQVFRSLHKLGELGVADTLSNYFFAKAKFMVNLHYEQGLVYFIVATYPEYQEIIQSAISAQYPDTSIETITKPAYFAHAYRDIVPLEPKKDIVFPIKTFKQIEDDPINNVIDSMGELGDSDTFDIVIQARPCGSKFNKRAQRRAEGLYRNDKNYINPDSVFKKIVGLPFGIFDFILFGKKKDVPGNNDKYQEGGKDFVRMTKAKEDALNVMGEEAGRHAFECNLYLVSSSSEHDKPKSNIRNMVGIFNIYKDEFNNELDLNEWKADIFGRILKPIWKFLYGISSVSFFFKSNVFTENQLTSIFHFPDGAFNRSPSIKWMDYKVLAGPDNLYKPKEPTGYVVSGSISEGYLHGKIPLLFPKDSRAY